jgi:hypothetical protein
MYVYAPTLQAAAPTVFMIWPLAWHTHQLSIRTSTNSSIHPSIHPVVMIHSSNFCIVFLRRDNQGDELTVCESGNNTEIVGEEEGQGK